jgi:hypothetical protein
MCIGLHLKYPLFLFDFNETWVFSTDFRKNSPISNFMKIGPMPAEFFHANRQADERMDGQTGRQAGRETDMAKLINAILRTRLKIVLIPQRCDKNGKLKGYGFKPVNIRSCKLVRVGSILYYSASEGPFTCTFLSYQNCRLYEASFPHSSTAAFRPADQ